MTSVRALDISHRERGGPGAAARYLKQVCEKAVREEQAGHGVILGCLGMAGYGEMLEKELPVKVIDPAFIAPAYAEMSVRLGLVHATAVYPVFRNASHVEL